MFPYSIKQALSNNCIKKKTTNWYSLHLMKMFYLFKMINSDFD